MHDYNVKVPNFTFCEGHEHLQQLAFFPEHQYSLLQFSLQKNLPTFDELNKMK